jgi:hypothetical protein
MKKLLSILCMGALICTLGVACNEFDEPVPPQQNVEQQTVETVSDGSSVRIMLSPGTVLSAAAADYFGDGEIIGLDVSFVGLPTTFQIPPGVPQGVTFSNWQIEPSTGYTTATTSLPTLNITFNEAKYYTLRAWFTFQNGRAEIWKRIEVKNPPVITGPDRPYQNTDVSYSIPTQLPLGVSFVEWEVNPGPNTGACVVYGTMTGTTLDIMFRPSIPFTITAKFSLNGVVFTSVKNITSVVQPLVPVLEYVNDGFTAKKIRATNVLQGAATYEWEVHGQIIERGRDYIRVLPRDYGAPTGWSSTVDVRCRMTVPGVGSSAWSGWFTVGGF